MGRCSSFQTSLNMPHGAPSREFLCGGIAGLGGGLCHHLRIPVHSLGNASVKMPKKGSMNQQGSETGSVDFLGRGGEKQGSRQRDPERRLLSRSREHKSLEDRGLSSHCVLSYRRGKDLRWVLKAGAKS